jgi:CheY-like chemotaxis protein
MAVGSARRVAIFEYRGARSSPKGAGQRPAEESAPLIVRGTPRVALAAPHEDSLAVGFDLLPQDSPHRPRQAVLALARFSRGAAEIPQPWDGARPVSLPDSSAMPARRPSVVIVDDHAGFRSAACALFAARGYDVVGAADSRASLGAIFDLCVPDLVVLDVGLGAENGFDVARALTDAHPSVAVLLVSASNHHADPQRVRDSGACGFIPKSQLMTVDIEEIWVRIDARSPTA